MTPERIAELVARWVRLYTRGLPEPVARRRIEEIDADLHDHIAHERARGTAEWRTAVGIAARMVRGLAADASWRRQLLGRRSGVRVVVVTVSILLVPFVAMQFSDEVDWSLADFVFAGVLLGGTGALLELGARKPRNLAYRVAAAAVGIAAVVLGDADDAPGLVLFGGLLVVGTVALTIRAAQRGD